MGLIGPHRYTLRTELRVGGSTTDICRTTFGIRAFRFDPDEGFPLNGAYHKIKSVDLHHDLGALGAAVNADAIRRQMTIRKSMGVNAFRTSHNPPSPETTEATGDDKTFTDGPYPGSYTSPNGSAAKLHLTWKVPYAPGELKAVARSGGRVVATDVLRTAGAPHDLKMTARVEGMRAGKTIVRVTPARSQASTLAAEFAPTTRKRSPTVPLD